MVKILCFPCKGGGVEGVGMGGGVGVGLTPGPGRSCLGHSAIQPRKQRKEKKKKTKEQNKK